MILATCPQCHRQLKSPDALANQLVKCPHCQTAFTVPSLSTAPAVSSPISALQTAEASSLAPPTVAVATRVWRYFSLPWVATIFLFGFLPWSEVSCNSKEFEIRLTQSGYQGLYGGISAPPALEAMLAEETTKRKDSLQAQRQTTQGLHNKLQMEQEYLANVSPFLVIFWSANLALLGLICCAPLGARRLGFALPLCGLMSGVLVLHACLGMPLERRAVQVIGEAMREDSSQGMLFLAFKSGKSVWFWLTLASVLLLATTEPLLNWFRAERFSGWLVPGGIAGAAAVLMLGGILVQFALRATIVGEIENRIAQLRQAEESQRRRAEAEQRKREENRLAEVRAHEAEMERLRRQSLLKEQQARLLEQEARLREQQRQKEREMEERRAMLEMQRLQEEARRKAEQEAKEEAAKEAARKAELDKKAEEEAARETTRRAELEKKGLPYYPRPLSLHEERNAQEWYQMLRDRPNDARLWPRGTKALVALKSEGIPFLLDNLARQTTMKDRHRSLRLIQVEYVHPNDLHKLLPCLERGKASSATRMLALSYLQKRAKDLKKKLVSEIESLVEDMLSNSGFKEETKEEIKNMLNTIRMESK